MNATPIFFCHSSFPRSHVIWHAALFLSKRDQVPNYYAKVSEKKNFRVSNMLLNSTSEFISIRKQSTAGPSEQVTLTNREIGAKGYTSRSVLEKFVIILKLNEESH